MHVQNYTLLLETRIIMYFLLYDRGVMHINLSFRIIIEMQYMIERRLRQLRMDGCH